MRERIGLTVKRCKSPASWPVTVAPRPLYGRLLNPHIDDAVTGSVVNQVQSYFKFGHK